MMHTYGKNLNIEIGKEYVEVLFLVGFLAFRHNAFAIYFLSLFVWLTKILFCDYQVLNRSMDPKTYEPPPPLISQLPPVQLPLLPQVSLNKKKMVEYVDDYISFILFFFSM